MINLKCYSDYLFNKARNLSYCRSCLMFVELIILVILLFVPSETKTYYYALLFVVLFHVIGEYLKHKINRANMLSFKFEKIVLLKNAYGTLPSDFELADLKSESLSFDTNLQKCLNQKKEDYKTDFNIKDSSKPEKILLSMLQENAFWNHHQFMLMYLQKRRTFLLWILIPFVVIVFTIPFFSSINCLNIEKFKNFLAIEQFKILYVFLSFGLLYEIFEEMTNYKRASLEMNELDNEISRVFEKDDAVNSAMSLLVKYHFVKAMCPYIDPKIYETHGEGLNKAWDFRVMNSLNEVIKKIAYELKDIKEPWTITGGANLYIKGCKSKTHDIDIMTTKEGLEEIDLKLGVKITMALEKTTSKDKNLKSYFLLAKIGGRDIDIMGLPEAKVDDKWKALEWYKNYETIDIEGLNVNMTTIEFEKKTQEIIYRQKMYSLDEKCKVNKKDTDEK